MQDRGPQGQVSPALREVQVSGAPGTLRVTAQAAPSCSARGVSFCPVPSGGDSVRKGLGRQPEKGTGTHRGGRLRPETGEESG